MRIRVSLVEYLNSAPLGWSFLRGPHREVFEVVPSVPSACADQLASGVVDAGLIPSVEYQRIPGLRIIPGISIAAERAVRSVLLVRRRRCRIRRVALDSSSRTSVVLTKLLLRSRMGLDPEFVERRPNLSQMLAECDAALIIGDTALKLMPGDYEILDLAEEWIAWQHMPFVFAFWACRAEAAWPEDAVSLFHEAKHWGLAALPEIERSYSTKLKLPVAFLHEYLSKHITYELAESHLEGLHRFYELAKAAGLVEKDEIVRFMPPSLEPEPAVPRA